MNITTEPHQEVWHDMREPGAYEWWYFDAEDKESGVSVVLIWFSGFPFSPYYMQRYDDWKHKSGSALPLPADHTGFSFQLYEQGSETLNFIREGGNGLFESSREGIGLRFEKNRFFYDAHKDEYRLLVDFDFPARNRQVQAELLFQVSRRAHYSKNDANNAETGSQHQWLLSVPKALVGGFIEITGENGGGVRRIELRAQGYHDHNLGTMPMQEYIARWYWGRAFSERYDVIYYVIFFKNSDFQPLSFLMLHDNRDEQVSVMDSLQCRESEFSSGLFSPLHGRTLELSHERASLTVSQKNVLDAGPFYLRFASNISLQVDGQHLNGISGISEFLNPVRLQSRFMRFFTRSRIWRDKEPSFMYDYYNFFKSCTDWFKR
ncbi:MAG: carotenoid 1,2-hydratase [Chlorobium limicola]|uniref:Hydroxyneurosporene synthase n=1 Tax=Chlorobium limicola (strain DSM 245 / NBRC 103803 / 6330) TaxID=290315 RepID=B3EFH0_CHLL2|nr:carotenoid 1,2-hydratase [Chlorobium limicola]ACD89453.1 hydroxyneurosporene synthase [Chlorobium limicola DSM 245]NTV20726.1 carotenoid 1,2-hydratase [Chlorobium limicola]